MASNSGLVVFRRLAPATAATLLLAGAAAAAPGPSPASTAPAPAVREVVVPGQAPKATRQRQVETFTRRVPALNNGQALARWTQPICPVVVGMTEEQGEYVLRRLFQVARAAGAPAIEDGRCGANVFIIATADPQALAKAIERRAPTLFAQDKAGQARQFEETGRPVRTWYNARLDRLSTTADSPFEGLDGIARGTPVIHHAVPSHLHTNSPYGLYSAIVVIDSAHAAGTKVGAMADYLAMAALTQLQPDADGGGAPSILKLFSTPAGQDPPDGLTPWDSAFLHALYNTSMEDMHQASTIALHMDEALGRAEAEH